MVKFFSMALLLLALQQVNGQLKVTNRSYQYFDVTLGAGSDQQTAALSYNYLWKLGKKSKWELGAGVRWSSYFGQSIYYKTAPARLTSGQTGPGVLFANDILPNIDSLLLAKAQTNSINLSINIGYNFSSKWSAGFNIDAIGFSFGGKKDVVYYGNNYATGVVSAAVPTHFNLLLISDNDKGSLNSELFVKYRLNRQWGLKGVFQFLFSEYTTATKVQTTPDGQLNDRFRQKMVGGGVGVTYQLK